MKNTGMWPMINPFFLDMLSEEQITKKDIDIAIILQHYDKEENHFKLGQVIKKITQEDINRTFELPMKGKTFNFEKKQRSEYHCHAPDPVSVVFRHLIRIRGVRVKK